MKARSAISRSPDLPVAEPAAPDADPSWREVVAVLDEELARVPEKLRGPLVLCYLEGLTRDEAAARLGCPLGTLKGRLERGRELLRRRLERRGLALSTILAALALERLTVSPALASAAVNNVLTQAVSTRVLDQAQGIGSTSPFSLVKSTLALLLLAGAVIAGATAFFPSPQQPPPSPPAE